MWAKNLRANVNHRQDDTTGICEGSHSSVKSLLDATGGEAQRVDHFLLHTVEELHTFEDVRAHYSTHCLLPASITP